MTANEPRRSESPSAAGRSILGDAPSESSKQGSPSTSPPEHHEANSPHGGDTFEDSSEAVASCRWEDCRQVFDRLQLLIDHIQNDHVGSHKSSYSCEWTDCPRKGISQTSKFAIISHLRSHTGERPFPCTTPGCEKSFTRSDALAKHMKTQHGIETRGPGRGGAGKKRKREKEEASAAMQIQPIATATTTTSISPEPPMPTEQFGMFKVEPAEPVQHPEQRVHHHHHLSHEQHHPYHPNQQPPLPPNPNGIDAHANHHGHHHHHHRHHHESDNEDDDGYASSDSLPASLKPHYDPVTGTVHGRPVALAKYLVVKAEYAHVKAEKELLEEELRHLQGQLALEQRDKEFMLDRLLDDILGPEGAAPLYALQVTPHAGNGSMRSRHRHS